jgi:multimeric flavodoxin WrbA
MKTGESKTEEDEQMMMNKKGLVILGSSREDSNTLKAVQKLLPFPYDLIDLYQKKIQFYEYKSQKMEEQEDDFYSIATEMLLYDRLIFATPVYWYSMSGRMKIFFDRLTELTDTYKPIGKALKGKEVYLVASGASPGLPEGFEIPFRLTAEYFDMKFIQTFYQQGG